MKNIIVAWAKKPGERGFSFIDDRIVKLGFTPEELARKLADSPLKVASQPRLAARCYPIEVQCKDGSCIALEVVELFLHSKMGKLLRSAGIIRPLERCPICGVAEAFQNLALAHQEATA